MGVIAKNVVAQAQAWLGKNEADGSHREIIDIYNAHRPLARGYKVTYKDPWCATFVSAVAIKLGCTDIIPTECSCTRMIALLKEKGSFNESDSRVPTPGDILFYVWSDNGVGDNKDDPDHVGIVEKVVGDTIHVIEGNYSDSVKRRTLRVNGKYIRGYGVPKYDEEPKDETPTPNSNSVKVELSTLKKGSKGDQVKAVQRMLYSMGYDLGASKVDGDFGSKTDAAVKAYQNKNSLTADGIVGQKTWDKLLKG